MNAPDKILFGLACISAMLFIANEMKLFADNCRPTVYMFTSACTLLFCATSSVPSIIAYHAGMLPEKNGLYSEYYLLLGLAIYAASRLVTATLNINTVACGLDTNHPTDDVTNSDGEHDDKENTEQP